MNKQTNSLENRSSRRPLGKTGIEVSPVAMGCWPIAGMTSLGVNDADSLATLHAAIDSGVNFFDNAYGYGANGESERLLGQALKERSSSHRQEIVVASKAGMHWEADGQRKFDASPARIVSQCEESLQRLGVDRIDVYYLHAHDPNVPLEDSAGAFAELATVQYDAATDSRRSDSVVPTTRHRGGQLLAIDERVVGRRHSSRAHV